MHLSTAGGHPQGEVASTSNPCRSEASGGPFRVSVACSGPGAARQAAALRLQGPRRRADINDPELGPDSPLGLQGDTALGAIGPP